MKKRNIIINTEESIQDLLYNYCSCNKRKLMVPNIFLFNWESDFISVSKLGLITEYEIKISIQDLKSDIQKKKHWYFENYESYYKKINCRNKDVIPSYFYYVIPDSLNTDGFKLPSYAGLIEIRCASRVNVVTNAPRLHTERISEHKLKYIANGLMLRYWRDRIHE